MERGEHATRLISMMSYLNPDCVSMQFLNMAFQNSLEQCLKTLLRFSMVSYFAGEGVAEVEEGPPLRAVAMDLYTWLLLDSNQDDEFDLEEGVRVALHSFLSPTRALRHSALESLTVL